MPPQSFIPVTGDSVGPLSFPANRADLDRLGRVVRDTTEQGDEDISERIAIVLVDGDSVRAALNHSGQVYAYYLTSARFRTRDSIGVGTSLSQLLRVPGVFATTGESQVFVHFPKMCGLDLRLSESGMLGESIDSVGASELSKLPKETHVTEVGVSGCWPKRSVAPPT
jgi:hypothetical protein